jgi:hypothetical protein
MKQILMFSLALAVGFSIFYFYQPYSDDFATAFFPVGKYVLENPYGDPYIQENLFRNLPYILPVLAALAALPYRVALAFWLGLNFASLVLFTIRAEFPLVSAVAFVAAPVALINVIYGNFDGIILLATTLNPLIGIPILLLKPHIGIGVILYWIIRPAVERDVWIFAERSGVTALVLLGSVVLYPSIIEKQAAVSSAWNTSLWLTPLLVVVSLAIGFAILSYSVSNKDKDFAIFSSFYLTPYITLFSLSILMVPFKRWPMAMVALSAGAWLGLVIFFA